MIPQLIKRQDKIMTEKVLRKGELKEENKTKIRAGQDLQTILRKKAQKVDMRSSGWGRFRLRVEKLINRQQFTILVFAAIVLNTITMAIEHHNQPLWLDTLLEIFNYFFTIVFAIEMLLKIIGFGLYGYIKDPFNVFDGTIVVTSLIEIFQTGSGAISVLRAFRMLRLIKLIRFMPALRLLFSVLISTLDEIAVFLALLALIIFIFRLCMSPDGNGACTCAELADPNIECACERVNFDTFVNASLTVFQVLTTEDWNSLLVNCMNMVSQIQAVIYFISLFFVGNYIMMNLVVAILVQGCMEIRQKDKQKKKESLAADAKVRMFASAPNDHMELQPLNQNGFIGAIAHPSFSIGQPKSFVDNMSMVTAADHWIDEDDSSDSSPNSNAQRNILQSKKLEIKFDRPYLKNVPESDHDDDDDDLKSTAAKTAHNLVFHCHLGPPCDHENKKVLTLACKRNMENLTNVDRNVTILPDDVSDNVVAAKCQQAFAQVQSTDLYQKYCVNKQFKRNKRWNYSFFILPTSNPIRKTCIKLVTSKWFDYLILFFIFLNCIIMIFENPSILPGSPKRITLDTFTYIFTAVFLLEMIVKGNNLVHKFT